MQSCQSVLADHDVATNSTWCPPMEHRHFSWLTVLARLKPGLTMRAAIPEVGRRFWRAIPSAAPCRLLVERLRAAKPRHNFFLAALGIHFFKTKDDRSGSGAADRLHERGESLVATGGRPSAGGSRPSRRRSRAWAPNPRTKRERLPILRQIERAELHPSAGT